ncbi:SOS response-associated peptidase family protein [Chitinophaga sp. MM2321]|uniref:SOS response-associated peptidase n=1 Tax=Chitinophaga sp. MM2321 TaxID=3137178 RepID=UPI0032D56FA3
MSYPAWPVVVDHNGARLEEFTWGPIPAMLNSPEKVKKQRQYYLNARSEKVLEKNTMWSKIRHQRCLIPSTGFFEYREVGLKSKVCYTINQGANKVFFIAGLWALSNSWDTDKSEKIPTFTLLTREANPLLKQIHNAGENPGRMPLMLTEDMLATWIRPDLDDAGIKEILDFSMPPDNLEYWPVNSVRKRHEDDESVLQRVEVEGLPPIEV